MSRVHITLVGGQPAPIYHGVIATSPDKVVYIVSSSTKKLLSALKKEIKIPSESILLDPTDPHKILSVVVSLAKQYSSDEVTVNISSGLKSWSHFFGVIFDSQPNAAVVYMDQNNILWNYKDMTSSKNFVFDMHALFRLYGNSIDNNYRRFSDYTEEDLRCIPQIENIRYFNIRDFNSLTALLTKEQECILDTRNYGTFYTENSDSYVEWEKSTPERVGYIRLVLYKRDGRCRELTYESENVVDILFNSAWFELKVATILSDWDKTKEICMNCRFPYNPSSDKNETDIIVNTGTKILFVECKTQIAKPTDIDKFRSVVKTYGGMGSKGLFITDAPMNDVSRKKCEENDIIHFSLKEDHGRVTAEQALYNLLNSELFNINPK